MIVLAYGGGVDSTGILCGWVEKGYQAIDPIDLILFADTGGERPRTYETIAAVSEWCKSHGLPEITIVKKGGRQETLEENCLRMNMLPSIAYGFKGCSHKYKIEPQEKYLNNHPAARAAWARGELITKLIGYEYREERRWRKARRSDDKYEYEFPLVEWQWSRPECLAAIDRMGLPRPGKSACFFCPSNTKPEIDQLRAEYPLLFQRALAMEDNAKQNLETVKGLGRRFSWREYAEGKPVEDSDIEVCRACIDG